MEKKAISKGKGKVHPNGNANGQPKKKIGNGSNRPSTATNNGNNKKQQQHKPQENKEKKAPTNTQSSNNKSVAPEDDREEQEQDRSDIIATAQVEVETEEDNSTVTFKDLGVLPEICEACELVKWSKPTPIQREAIPVALAGRDVIGLAQTGSGKTGAFAIPVLQTLLVNPQPFFALIVSPTRELAFQIAEQFAALGSTIGVKTCVIVGGISVTDQAIALGKKPHIICGTPGRLAWHLENTKGFNLKALKYLVMDEADRLLSMDYEEELNKILALIPKDRRTFMFSATMTSKVEKLQRASLRDPAKVSVDSKYATVETLVQKYVFMPEKVKDSHLVHLLNEFSGNSVIVFVATCQAAQRLAFLLRNLGFSAIPLHGQMDQSRRLGALSNFKTGDRNILIATDVASRGLDIPSVDIIVNYDIPLNPKDYVHRVGRTARAYRAGRAVALVTQYDVEYFQRIEKAINVTMELFPIEKEEVAVLQERVNAAQRFAAQELRELGWTGGKRGREEGNKKQKGGKKKKEAIMLGGAPDHEDGENSDLMLRKRTNGTSQGAPKKRRKGR